jgi:hypothetical protein
MATGRRKMSNIVKVQRRLDFRNGSASHGWNTEGQINSHNVVLQDYFTGISLDTTNTWTVGLPGTSDTIAISQVAGGSVLMTTGTADNDSCNIGSAIIFSGNKRAYMEADITITDVSGTGVFVGFSDAAGESNNYMAIHYPADSLDTVASDAAGFVIDADHASSSIMVASVKGNSDTTPVDLGVDWADGERRTLRVELVGDGTAAAFYMRDSDGTTSTPITGYLADSVTASTLLSVCVHAITRANDGSNTVRIHSIKAGELL